jgi:hypothetical protein
MIEMRACLLSIVCGAILGCGHSAQDRDLEVLAGSDRQEELVSGVVNALAARRNADAHWRMRFFPNGLPLTSETDIRTDRPVILQLVIVTELIQDDGKYWVVGYDMLLPIGTQLRLECTKTDADFMMSLSRTHEDSPKCYVAASLTSVKNLGSERTSEATAVVTGRCLEVVEYPRGD